MAETVFSDVNLDFIPHPVTGDVVKLKDAEAVKRSVRNLVLSNSYEHPYDHRKGGNIRGLLFENYGPEVGVAIKERVQYVIEKYEPRAELISVKVDDALIDTNNQLGVTIRFFVGSGQIPEEINVFLERVR